MLVLVVFKNLYEKCFIKFEDEIKNSFLSLNEYFYIIQKIYNNC